MACQEPCPSPDIAPVVHAFPPLKEDPSGTSPNVFEGEQTEAAFHGTPESSCLRAKRRASTDGAGDGVGPAVSGSASAEERAAAIEQETAAAEAAAKWPLPGPLSFQLEGEDRRARAGLLRLPHGDVETPIFMPVGTNGALKGVHLGLLHCIDRERRAAGGAQPQDNAPAEQVAGGIPREANTEGQLSKPPGWFSNLILGNTFHLYRQVGGKRMREVGKGLHRFMRWGANLLTDSGGFQMVSLCRMMDVFEEGVCFRLGPNGLKKGSKRKSKQKQRKQPKKEHHENETLKKDGNSDSESDEIVLLTPEESIFMQNQIGSDIIMQLDDVIASTTPDPQRVEDAMLRSIRWLDRCIVAHDAPDRQALFGIVQGGLDFRLRERALALFKTRACHGNAIGGLSGGERKSDFWQCTSEDKGLPRRKPRYLMGVGYALDLVVSVALGCDMFDCVFPCRTARFGTAVTSSGNIRIKQYKYASDLGPIDPQCDCYTCRSYSRAFLHSTFNKSPTAGQLLTLHNLYYLQHLCSEMRQSIKEKRFAQFVYDFLQKLYPRQTCSEGEKGEKRVGQKPAVKRRRLSATTDLKNESVSNSKNAASDESTNTTSIPNGLDGAASPDGVSGKPRPPEWVRDALLAAGIDIRCLYTSFDPME